MVGQVEVAVLIIIALIFPPSAVAFLAGCGIDLCINVLLTLLGYLPGTVHAFWLILRRAEANETYGYKNWTYTGMGDYHPIDRPPTQAQVPPPPPPSEQYPADTAPPPSQLPPDQKQVSTAPSPVEYAPPPGPPPETDQKQAPPGQPSDQKTESVTPESRPTDQKQTESTAQSTAPPGT